MKGRRINRFIAARCLVAAFWVVAVALGSRAFAQSVYKTEEPAFRGLDANLYMQTSAEYRACCYQAYNLATFRLKEAVSRKPEGKLAVVMDLDETVLDNAGFQASQVRNGLAYDQRIWDGWEEQGGDNVGLIPGATNFIHEVKRLGVTVVYISNRNEKFRAQNKGLLTRLGIPISAETQLKLSTGSSDKTERRKEAEREFTVLLYVGDNLRDFDEVFRCRKLGAPTADELEQAIRERKEAVDKQREIWGDKWIILPNPAYGEWMKPLGQGRSDLNRLVPAK